MILPNQPVTAKGDLPSGDLIRALQLMQRQIEELRARVAALEAP